MKRSAIYIDFYRRVVGRHIAARESLADKSNEQAVEDEIRHLQHVIAPLVERSPESISSEERFGEFPEMLPWSGTFFGKALVILFVFVFFAIPALGGIANAWFPEIQRTNVIFGLAVIGLLALISIILLQILAYHASTLREIAQKIVDAKKEYADYPIASVDEGEPLLMKTISEKFEISLESLKPETRLDTELGFEL